MGGRGGGFSFPNEREDWFSLVYQENEILPGTGRTKSMLRMVDILASLGRNLQAAPADGKARRTFVLRALFTLAAIYSRGTCRPTTIDVLMFHFRVRNGTGWDHQAMTTRFQGALRCAARCLPR